MEIVSKISLPDTLRRMKVGECITMEAMKTASFMSARSAVYRLNRAGGYKFSIESKDNGCTYTVERIA